MFWEKHPREFLSKEEQDLVMDEIRKAEDRTSGEIRVHLDRHAGEDVIGKARKVFSRLGMTRTKERNGVLFYLATDQRKFAILGDTGIHRVVPENYWEEVKEKMQRHFRGGRFGEGLCLGIRDVGEKLQAYFPKGKRDVNELPDEISREE